MHRRRYIAVVGAALVAGCGSDGEATQTATETETETQTVTATETQTATATSTPTATEEASIQVVVDYPDDWSGDLEVTAQGSMGRRSISHRGSQTYDVDPEASAVSVEVQKEDTTLRTLTVQILHNGEVVAEGSTEDEFGTVSLQERFD